MVLDLRGCFLLGLGGAEEGFRLIRVFCKGRIHKRNRGLQHEEALPHTYVHHRAVLLRDMESRNPGQGNIPWPSLSITTKPKALIVGDLTPLLQLHPLQGSALPGEVG